MYPSHPHGFSIMGKRELTQVLPLKRQSRLAYGFKSAGEKRKTKTSKGGRKTNKQQTKIPPGSQIVEWDALMQGRRAQAVALPEINGGYLDACFGFQGVVDLKWIVGEVGGGGGGAAQ